MAIQAARLALPEDNDESLAVLCDDLIDAEKNHRNDGAAHSANQTQSLGGALISLMTDHARRNAMHNALCARARDDAALEIARAAVALAQH